MASADFVSLAMIGPSTQLEDRRAVSLRRITFDGCVSIEYLCLKVEPSLQANSPLKSHEKKGIFLGLTAGRIWLAGCF